MFIQEVCVENFTDIPQAIEKGATRIELCDNLSVGGTTPSTGVLEESVQYCHDKNVNVMAIIRPRGGSFVYNDTELKIMHTDLIEAKKIGVDGIVIGCLTEDNWIDEEAMEMFIEISEGLQITFHMAFDAIDTSRQLEAIDWLAQNGVHRILTHGGSSKEPIEKHLDQLEKFVQHANDRLVILPGGGITKENKEHIKTTLNLKEVHGTKLFGNLV